MCKRNIKIDAFFKKLHNKEIVCVKLKNSWKMWNFRYKFDEIMKWRHPFKWCLFCPRQKWNFCQGHCYTSGSSVGVAVGVGVTKLFLPFFSQNMSNWAHFWICCSLNKTTYKIKRYGESALWVVRGAPSSGRGVTFRLKTIVFFHKNSLKRLFSAKWSPIWSCFGL